MSIFLRLSTLALKGVVHGACEATGFNPGHETVEGVISFLTDRFADQSQRLEEALRASNKRAWRSLEIALQADGFMKRLGTFFTSAEDLAFSKQVQAFLDGTPLPPLANEGFFRDRCLKELGQARTKFLEGRFDAKELARHTGNFARFSDPNEALDAEWRTCQALAEEVRRDGHEALHWLLSQRPKEGAPLLVIAVRYFFRRAIEEDAELFRGLTFAKLEAIANAHQANFKALSEAFRRHEGKIDRALESLHATVAETHGNVLDLKEMARAHSAQIEQLRKDILAELEKKQMAREEVKPSQSMSIRDDRERRVIKALMERYRALPEDQKEEFPALLHGLGKLGYASGEFKEAVEDFQRVAELVSEPSAQAEAHYNAYRAALEEGMNDVALKELLAAIKLDSKRFVPFPVATYVPQRILGAGGFGVAFLCRHKYMDGQVVVKALQAEGMDAQADKVFSEAQLLRQLDHPSIIRIAECGYADSDERTRAFLVMDYFDGQNLDEYVRRHGPLSVPDALAVVRKAAEALRAAHGRNILHRDIKPANLLVRKEEGEWYIKVIDFGLAMKAEMMNASTTRRNKTTIGRSIEGTIDYAPPEQMGRLPGVPVTAASDVFGWGKTFCFALFATASLTFRHWQSLPDKLADLLSECVEEQPKKRPQSFADVLTRLGRVSLKKEKPLDDVVVLPDPAPPVTPLRPPAVPAQHPEWMYIRPDGQQAGPITFNQLRDLLVTRQLDCQTMVWKPGMGQWAPASTVAGLAQPGPAPVARPALVAVPVEPAPLKPIPVRPVPVEEGPSWLVSLGDFAEATYRYWLSGRANHFAPNYQQIARQQPRADFVRDVRQLVRFMDSNDYPFFIDEALLGTAETMTLTNYRMVFLSPDRRVMCLPLCDIDHYSFDGAAGTWQGYLLGSSLRVSGRFGAYDWQGERLANLFFPTTEYVQALIAMREWRRLPQAALDAIDNTRRELRL
jgi:serine/threonine protein kinase